jgi:hypothetical protein
VTTDTTAATGSELGPLGTAFWILVLGGSTAALAAAVTVAYRAMRAVAEVGGYCADGGPYVSAQHCPQGTVAAVLTAVGLGIAGAILATIAAGRLGVPSPMLLAWAGGFGSMAWIYLHFGLHPVGGGSRSVSSLVCAGVFALAAVLPVPLSLLVRTARTAGAGSGEPRRTAPPEGDDVGALERLAALRGSGALSEREFERAKANVLGESA